MAGIAVNGWNGCKWLEWLQMAKIGCKWLKFVNIDGNGWMWLEWLQMAVNSWNGYAML